MGSEITFSIQRVRFDEDYRPSEKTRVTTNFANLARGENRRENLRHTFAMIDNRFNSLAHRDNPRGDRYAVELEIISADMRIGGESHDDAIPLIEILKTSIHDRKKGERIDGIAGHNLSSYVRDYDFSVVLPEANKDRTGFRAPEDFGALHGNLFKAFVNSSAYGDHFGKPPVICLSVSSGRTYRRTAHRHPVLGVEYRQDAYSLTDDYFGKMGLKVRYFMPPNSVAPLAFYCAGDLLSDYTGPEIMSTISTMDTFQKIYRPEIYNANSPAGRLFQPTLHHEDFSLTRISYDREERGRLAVAQGRLIEDRFIKPHRAFLERCFAAHVL